MLFQCPRCVLWLTLVLTLAKARGGEVPPRLLMSEGVQPALGGNVTGKPRASVSSTVGGDSEGPAA